MGISLKNVVVGMVAITGALTVFACGGTDAQVPEGATGTDESLLKEGACIDDSMGGATSCKTADTWKDYAATACKTKGLALSDFSLGASCSKDGFSSAKYSCCKIPPVPVPPTPPGPSVCFGDAQGGPTSCKPSSTWKEYASNACKAKGAELNRIDFAEECGKDLYRWTKYECCDATKPPPPPPPPPVCKSTVLGDPTSCKPSATWKEYAFSFCKDAGLVLNDLSLGASCGSSKDTYSSVKVSCCELPVTPPPPPPPPPACEGRYEGGPTSCKAPATWKLYASDSCAKDGLKLGELYYGASCGPGGESSEIKYTCCK